MTDESYRVANAAIDQAVLDQAAIDRASIDRVVRHRPAIDRVVIEVGIGCIVPCELYLRTYEGHLAV